MAAKNDGPEISGREIMISRDYDAPLALVWKAWTEPAHLAQWWGPNGFSITTFEYNFRPGGIWRFLMHGPDGRDWANRVTFREIVPHKKLVYDHGGEGADKGIQFHVTVTFAEKAGRTNVTMRSVFPTREELDKVVRENGALEGAKQHTARLAAYLPKLADQGHAAEKAFVFARELSAPRPLVFKAWTEPDQLARWWGPKGMKLEVLAADIRVGGRFHYAMIAPGGETMWGLMVFRELEPTQRIVWVNSFADKAGKIARAPFSPLIPLEMHNTVLLEDRGPKTLLTLRSGPINATKEERAFFEGMFKGMEAGFGGSFEQLEAWLTKGA